MTTTLVVGPGRVGCALALAHRRAGESVLLLGRSAGPWQAWAEQTGLRTLLGAAAAPERADQLLLALPDAGLEAGAAELAEVCAAALVVHTSGLHDLEVLAPFVARGAAVAALHPILPFAADPQTSLQGLAAATASLLAGAGAEARARAVAAVWGCAVQPVAPGADRSRYHLGLALAANHVTGLLGWAEKLVAPSLGAAAREVVSGLAAAAVERFREAGAAEALTGPVARGDHLAVSAHLAALTGQEAAHYCALLEPLVALALAAGRIDAAQAAALRAALAQQTGTSS